MDQEKIPTRRTMAPKSSLPIEYECNGKKLRAKNQDPRVQISELLNLES
jgi:hypothetical protein